MPEPIPNPRHDQQCHHYQAPTGARCGSPAMKGEYYCYFHHIKHRKTRILIDPEVTRMDLPVIEDRASIFVSLAAVVHRLAENTIDTKRAGQVIYALQTALQALPPEPADHAQCHPAPEHTPTVQPPPDCCHSDPEHREGEESPHFESDPATPTPTTAPQLTTNNQQPTTPKRIPIAKESLLYFLRARHCYHCNRELFPPEELTERPFPGAPPQVVEENDHIKRLSDRYPGECSPARLLDLNAVGEVGAPHLASETAEILPTMNAGREGPHPHRRAQPQRPHLRFALRIQNFLIQSQAIT